MLARQLVRCVGRQRRFRRVFINRFALAVVAVHRRTGGVQHTFDPGQTHGFADIQRADEIALVSLHRIIHRRLHRGHGGQMRDRAAALHRLRHQCRIGDIADNQLDPRIIQRQIAAFAGRQIVEDPHRMALGEQGIRQVRADETGAAGD